MKTIQSCFPAKRGHRALPAHHATNLLHAILAASAAAIRASRFQRAHSAAEAIAAEIEAATAAATIAAAAVAIVGSSGSSDRGGRDRGRGGRPGGGFQRRGPRRADLAMTCMATRADRFPAHRAAIPTHLFRQWARPVRTMSSRSAKSPGQKGARCTTSHVALFPTACSFSMPTRASHWRVARNRGAPDNRSRLRRPRQ